MSNLTNEYQDLMERLRSAIKSFGNGEVKTEAMAELIAIHDALDKYNRVLVVVDMQHKAVDKFSD